MACSSRAESDEWWISDDDVSNDPIRAREICRVTALNYIKMANNYSGMKEKVRVLIERTKHLTDPNLTKQVSTELERRDNILKERKKELQIVSKTLKMYSSKNLITDDTRKELEGVGLKLSDEIKKSKDESEISQRKSDRKYNTKGQESSKSCKSDHKSPFCENCGWQSHWVKRFMKRGVYINEDSN